MLISINIDVEDVLHQSSYLEQKKYILDHIGELNPEEVLNNLNLEDIISYLEELNYKVEQ